MRGFLLALFGLLAVVPAASGAQAPARAEVRVQVGLSIPPIVQLQVLEVPRAGVVEARAVVETRANAPHAVTLQRTDASATIEYLAADGAWKPLPAAPVTVSPQPQPAGGPHRVEIRLRRTTEARRGPWPVAIGATATL